jgi:hypothetical protein
MTVAKSIVLFAVAALFEIGGDSAPTAGTVETPK